MTRDPIACPECGAESPPSSKFCEGCGLMLSAVKKEAAKHEAEGEPAEEKPARRARRAEPDKAQRFAIEHQLRRARRTLRSVRALYAVLTLATLIWIGIYFASGVDAPVVLIVLVAQGLLLLAGTLFLFSQPLMFTLALACLFTVTAIWTIATTGSVPPLDTFSAVCLWFAAPIVAGVMKLKREYPDLVDTSKLQKRKRYEAATSAALARSEQRRGESRSSSMRTFAYVGGAVLLAVVLYFPISAAMASEPPEDPGPKVYTASELATIGRKLEMSAGEFRRSWERDDTKAVGEMFATDRFITFWPKVERLFRRKGWESDLPELASGQDVRPGSPSSQQVWFSFDAGGTMKTTWRWEDDEDRWRMTKITVKDVD